jgi:hypothetical protein
MISNWKFAFWSALLLITIPIRAEMSGDDGARVLRLSGRLDEPATGPDECLFSTEFDPTMFKINSFKNKYKIVRIKVENRRAMPIRLSSMNDTVALELAGKKVVRGILTLQEADAATWDTLPEDLMQKLAYPLNIGAAPGKDGVRKRAEVVYFFVFFPAAEVSEVPVMVHMTIDSLKKKVTMKAPPAVAA